ncbi:hypothetical protein [Cecembia lonarensis]|uniref:Uncharacterized protein n=1 Tax=Cecembia lonarensis (strain CCUG 58316 / KCTC 22772 / LW9) TaxID=1225176 RepID=K1KYN5_CECL9|nr:hypothetical protein [Cecembia lonarensis]EKB47611.1 hypothetical protein B879_03770 [Cecembia lonarensis LW9]
MTIDHFELMVLIESSWNPGTILRYSIIKKSIDTWFFDLNRDQAKAVYNYFNTYRFTKEKSIFSNEIQDIFFHRFDPSNQYDILVKNEGKKETLKAFRYKNSYWVSSDTRINEDYILLINKV